MASKATIAISILADAKKFSKGLDSASSKVGKFGKGLRVAAGVAAAGFGTAVGAAAGFFAKSLKAANAATPVYTKTATLLANMGDKVGRTTAQLDAQAVSLSKLSGMDDVAIRSAQNYFMAMQLGGRNLDNATKAAVDLAAANHKSIEAVSKNLAKALGAPTSAVSLLRREGVLLTQQQQEQIKTLVARGDTAKAQAIILSATEDTYAGAAERAGKTVGGAEARARSAFGRLQVQVGQKLQPAVAAAFGKMADGIDRLTEGKGFQKFTGQVSRFFTNILNGKAPLSGFLGDAVKMASAFSPVATIFKALKPVLPPLLGSLKSLGGSVAGVFKDALPIVQQVSGVIVDALSGALATVLPPVISLIGTVVDSLKKLLPIVGPLAAQLADAFGGAVQIALPIVAKAAGILASILSGTLKTAVSFISSQWSWLGPLAGLVLGVVGAFKVAALATKAWGVAMAAGKAISAAWAAATKVAAAVQAAFNTVMSANPVMLIVTAIALLIAGLVVFFTRTKVGRAIIAGFFDFVKTVFGWLGKTGAAVFHAVADAVSSAWNSAKKITQKIWGGIKALFRGLGGFFSGVWRGIVSGVSGFLGRIVGKIRSIRGAIVGVFSGAGSWLLSAGKNIVHGLINGVTSLAGSIGRFFLNRLPGWIRKPFQAALGIHSPSTLFAQYGSFITQGLVQGLSDTGAVQGAMRRLSGVVSGTTLHTAAPQRNALAESTLLTEMTAGDRAFFARLFQEFAASLTITDGVIALAGQNASSRLTRTGAR